MHLNMQRGRPSQPNTALLFFGRRRPGPPSSPPGRSTPSHTPAPLPAPTFAWSSQTTSFFHEAVCVGLPGASLRNENIGNSYLIPNAPLPGKWKLDVDFHSPTSSLVVFEVHRPKQLDKTLANTTIVDLELRCPEPDSSPYFETLFSSDFSEATATRPSQRGRYSADTVTNDYEDSDGETDEAYETKQAKPACPVRGGRSVLIFLTTGYIDFAPLRSASLPLNPKATSTRADALTFRSSKSPSLPFAVSPKSVYRLAHFLGLSDLQSLVLAQIKSSLQVETVAFELFSPTSLAYEEVQKVVFELVVSNLKEVEATESYKSVAEAVERRERPEGAPMLIKLLQVKRRKA
ncbi:hypothetical protein JCM8547_002339 [Rhodosporidiobolus lusitaniae]